MNLLSNERGSQAIEFIGVLPLFALMIMVIWQFSLGIMAKMTAEAAAMDGARMAMVDSAEYETAARRVASKYTIPAGGITKQDSADGKYVTVKVTVNVPLLNNKMFDTTNLTLPVSSEVTMQKED